MTTELEEKLIEAEAGFLGRLVKVYVETVRLPNGEIGRREIVRHPGAVAVVALTAQQEVLLVKQYRGAARQVMLEIPAGTLEPDEDPVAAAIRELQEETGLKPGKIEPLAGEFTAPGYTTEFIHIYLATELTDSPLEPDTDEFIEMVRVPFDEALHQVESGKLQDGKTIIGLLMTARKLGK